jgi:hypothetical protein
MTYYRIGRHCSRIDWWCTLEDHLQGSERETGRQVYIGIDASKGAREIVRQIELARDNSATGIAIFSFTDANNANVWPLLARGVFAEKARVPTMPWKQREQHQVGGSH